MWRLLTVKVLETILGTKCSLGSFDKNHLYYMYGNFLQYNKILSVCTRQ